MHVVRSTLGGCCNSSGRWQWLAGWASADASKLFLFSFYFFTFLLFTFYFLLLVAAATLPGGGSGWQGGRVQTPANFLFLLFTFYFFTFYFLLLVAAATLPGGGSGWQGGLVQTPENFLLQHSILELSPLCHSSIQHFRPFSFSHASLIHHVFFELRRYQTSCLMTSSFLCALKRALKR